MNPNKKAIYENMSINPSDIFPLLKNIYIEDLNIPKKMVDYKYSQIFYPGKNYEFIYFLSNDIIYKYQTINPLPNFKYSLEEILSNKT